MIITKKGMIERNHCINFHFPVGQNAAGRKDHGIIPARNPAVGWNFKSPIIKGPKP
jgi:hypothetical protein